MAGMKVRIPQLLPPEDLELRFEWDQLERERRLLQDRYSRVAAMRLDVANAVFESLEEIEARFNLDYGQRPHQQAGRFVMGLVRATVGLVVDVVATAPRQRHWDQRVQPRINAINARLSEIGIHTEQEVAIGDWRHEALYSTIAIPAVELASHVARSYGDEEPDPT